MHTSAKDPEKLHWLPLTAAISSICSGRHRHRSRHAAALSVILEARGISATMIGLNTADLPAWPPIAAAPIATPIAARFGVVPTLVFMIIAVRCLLPRLLLRRSLLDVVSAARRAPRRADHTIILSEFSITSSAQPRQGEIVLGVVAPPVLALGSPAAPGFSPSSAAGLLPSVSPSGWSRWPPVQCRRLA